MLQFNISIVLIMKHCNPVSIILPCYNMGKFIGEALESVAAQTYPHWELIAVDDCGPEDGTREAVEDFAARHPTRRVEFIRLPENRGVSGARNAGAAAARGELLAFLDPDDLWQENHLQCHVRAHDPSLEPIVTASRVVFWDDEAGVKIEKWGYSDWESRIFPSSLGMRNTISPSIVVMPACVFKQLGGFDETPAIQHSEDWDLWLRVLELGIPFKLLDEITGIYRKHEGSATANRLLMLKRVQAFTTKNHVRLIQSLSFATWQLSQRVDGLESRLNALQRNPLVRLISLLQRLGKRG